jgi:hypothetical protein
MLCTLVRGEKHKQMCAMCCMLEHDVCVLSSQSITHNQEPCTVTVTVTVTVTENLIWQN